MRVSAFEVVYSVHWAVQLLANSTNTESCVMWAVVYKTENHENTVDIKIDERTFGTFHTNECRKEHSDYFEENKNASHKIK